MGNRTLALLPQPDPPFYQFDQMLFVEAADGFFEGLLAHLEVLPDELGVALVVASAPGEAIIGVPSFARQVRRAG